jgi:hypothetical protein
VLQAGTAVLVDNYGVPRARCACGNPLLPPRSVSAAPSYTGTRWPGFSPTNVTVIVKNTTVINVITIIDVNTGQPLGRKTGPERGPDMTVPPPTTTTTGLTIPPNVSAGTGDVQVTLLWQGTADLDLHVIDPAGNEVSFGNKTSPTGGTLDVDANAGCTSTGGSDTRVENIFWPRGGAPTGAYRAFVSNFDACGSTNFSLQLRILVNNQVVYNQTQTVGAAGGERTQDVPFQR